MIKICGLTRLHDAEVAVRHGATALGFVCWPRSPRYIAAEAAAAIVRAQPPEVMTVGVFVDESLNALRQMLSVVGMRAIQLHGHEPASYASQLDCQVLKALGVEQTEMAAEWPPETLIVLDAIDSLARGGTGRRLDWDAAREFARQRRVVLAGGLTPENVAEAIKTVRPFGVDVSSGVESAPGIKDEDKVRRFVAAARAAFSEIDAREQSGTGL